MKAPDIFGIVIRVLGILLVLWSLWYLTFGVAFVIHALHDTGHESDSGAYFTTGIPGFIVGIALLRFGRMIVRFGYPSEKQDSEP